MIQGRWDGIGIATQSNRRSRSRNRFATDGWNELPKILRHDHFFTRTFANFNFDETVAVVLQRLFCVVFFIRTWRSFVGIVHHGRGWRWRVSGSLVSNHCSGRRSRNCRSCRSRHPTPFLITFDQDSLILIVILIVTATDTIVIDKINHDEWLCGVGSWHRSGHDIDGLSLSLSFSLSLSLLELDTRE